MSCKFSKFNGKCELFDNGIENNGCDEEGNCICEEDPDPLVTCEQYESIDDDSEEEEE